MQHNGPAIWRTERKEIALQAILAKVPACREGVLPDASTGQGLGIRQLADHRVVTVQGTPSLKLRSPKEGMAHFLPSLPSEALAKEGMLQILLSTGTIAVQV